MRWYSILQSVYSSERVNHEDLEARKLTTSAHVAVHTCTNAHGE